VAQGTFYYYFDSKMDMLEAVLGKNFSALENELASINNQTGIDPCEKLNRIINCMFRFDRSKRKLTGAAHLEGNTYLHHKLEEMSHTKLIPHITAVLSAGIARGEFHAPYPEETADVLFHALLHLLHEPALLADKARRKRTGVVLEHFFQSVLGFDDHRIKLEL
jgi:AcrR family transcriptional regulator